MLFSDLPLVTVSALTLGGIATNKSATDQQLEDEKKKTETERQKNGKSQFRRFSVAEFNKSFSHDGA